MSNSSPRLQRGLFRIVASGLDILWIRSDGGVLASIMTSNLETYFPNILLTDSNPLLFRTFRAVVSTYSKVPLRTLEQWCRRDAITLPTEIRSILEATYSEPIRDVPAGWQELRNQLEDRKQKLAASALSAANVWCMPALPDEEGVQTRYSSYPVAQLLLARKITRIDRHSVELHLLNDEVVVAHERDWKFATKRAIHRNLTRMPRWGRNSIVPGLCWHESVASAIGVSKRLLVSSPITQKNLMKVTSARLAEALPGPTARLRVDFGG